jgi:hypothetical protein
VRALAPFILIKWLSYNRDTYEGELGLEIRHHVTRGPRRSTRCRFHRGDVKLPNDFTGMRVFK